MTSVQNEKLLDFLESLNITKNQVCEDELTSTVTYVVKACHVPPLQNPNVPYTASDFESVANNAEIQLSVILRILDRIYSAKKGGQKFSPVFTRNVVVSCFLVACEYIDENWEWGSKKTANTSESVMNKLCEVCNCRSVQTFLTHTSTDTAGRSSTENDMNAVEKEKEVFYLKYILQRLSEMLNKNNWKIYPALKMSYVWILHNIRREHVEEHLVYLLPPALFIVDDWEQQNKVLGLKCLHYILEITTGSELRWYGRAAVIYNALKPILHSREAEVLEVLYPAIIKVAVVLDSDPSNTGQLKNENIRDVILQQLLRDMRYEQNLALRCVYANELPRVLAAMGIFAIRWSQDLMDVCTDYIATYDGATASSRISILRVHIDASSMMQMVVRLLYDVTDEDSDYSPQTLHNVTQEAGILISFLHSAVPKTCQELCQGLGDIPVHPQCQLLLKKIFSPLMN
ncbi:TELO2-interacting protein 2-like [Homarus americanus]|uniref:TELO2-interacting protein 2-like n=1 Tax=Homarus americanus TaxID=6706 RepID=A0A8J5JMB4_HOMAM|nr:TELO2-interacting protein 2-like [Homarus americanus]